MKKTILLILLLFMLSACRSHLPEEFMGGYDVSSGDYYLLAEEQSLLLDNPQLLQQYQNELRIKKRKTRPFSTCDILPFCSLPPLSMEEAGDNTLQLMHRKKGLILNFHKVKSRINVQAFWLPEKRFDEFR